MPRSEEQVLALLDEYFDPAPPSLELGRGDDCAEFSVHGPLALSTDLFLEDIHFRRAYFLPEEIGRKALAVNLSDLAAAGAAPL
ncbi:MAG: thiamine-phosphate kinase, partial [Deltaproteobacteria bacterium]|nr:thiamine-phosphate kinase [Deltaproteobacteria bacterium]